MQNTASRAYLTLGLTVALLLLCGPRCEAQPSLVTVHFQLDRGGTPPGSPPEITLLTTSARFVGLCRDWNPQWRRHCDANQFQWHLTILGGGGLTAVEEVKILNAPNHPDCFAQVPFTFDDTNTAGTPPFTHDSGTPKTACSQDKFGTYWPYVIEYWNNGVLQASTDPGGVIFP